MVFVKEYFSKWQMTTGLHKDHIAASRMLNEDILLNPQWNFEVVGYSRHDKDLTAILVKRTGLSETEFKHYENSSD